MLSNCKRMNTGLVALALGLCVACALFPAAAWADGGPVRFSVGSAQAETGQDISLEITVANNPGFACGVFELQYDSNALQLTSVAQGNLSAGGQMLHNSNYIALLSSQPIDNSLRNGVVGDGVLLRLSFHVVSNAVTNSYSVSLGLKDSNEKQLVGANGVAVPPEFYSGVVTVVAPNNGNNNNNNNGNSNNGAANGGGAGNSVGTGTVGANTGAGRATTGNAADTTTSDIAPATTTVTPPKTPTTKPPANNSADTNESRSIVEDVTPTTGTFVQNGFDLTWVYILLPLIAAALIAAGIVFFWWRARRQDDDGETIARKHSLGR